MGPVPSGVGRNVRRAKFTLHPAAGLGRGEMWEQASHLAAFSPPGGSGHALGVSGDMR